MGYDKLKRHIIHPTLHQIMELRIHDENKKAQTGHFASEVQMTKGSERVRERVQP